MRRPFLRAPLAAALLSTLMTPTTADSAPPNVPPAPPAPREDVVDVVHGVTIADPYRWLEDRDSPRTRAFVEAQEARTRAVLDALPGRDRLEETIASFVRVDSTGMPLTAGGREIFLTRSKDQEQHVLVAREDGRDRVLIDPNAMDESRLTSVSPLALSHDGKLLAYAMRLGGADETDLRLLDVGTAKPLGDVLPRARYQGVAIAHDGSGFWYSIHAPAGPRIRWHALGTDPASDADVFGEGLDSGKGVSPSLSHDGRWLVLTTWYGSASPRTDIHVKDVRAKGPVVPIVTGVEARFWGDVGDGTLYVQTNLDAPRGRVLAIDLEHPERERWREVVPQQAGTLDGFTLAAGRIVLLELKDVQPALRVFTPAGVLERSVEFETAGSASSLSGDWDRPGGYLAFSSWTVPPTIWKLEVASGLRTEWDRLRVPMRSSKYAVEQVWYESTDGVRVPMFLARAKSARPDGERPVLLTGYGGFLSSEAPSWSPKLAAWLELGGMVALPCLRGGGEYGEEWHRGGMLGRKQQTFDDFTRAAEWLIEQGWTRPGRLAISGRSNGGLLTGAAITQRPELFAAAYVGYPLLDMVRYHQFLVARYWVPEYGSSEDAEQAKWLHAYSPYHRVEQGGKYPAVLLSTGDSDTRVDPLHARKMTALLQHASGSGEPVLLHYDTKMGHVGGQPALRQVEEIADELSFFAWQLGMPLATSDRGKVNGLGR